MSLENKTNFAIDKVEQIMQLDDYTEIPAKHLAMEIIIKNNDKKPMFG